MPHLLFIAVLATAPVTTSWMPDQPKGPLLGWLLRTGRMSSQVDADQVDEVLRRGETVYLDGGSRSAAAMFGAMLLDPSFWKLSQTPSHDNIRYDLAGALIQQGSYGRAREILVELIQRSPPSAFRSPAFRKLTDLTLASGQFEQSLTVLASLPTDMSRDEADEMAYLKGKALVFLGFAQEAEKAFEAVSRQSRFRAASLYLLAVLALERGDTDTATSRLCRIVRQPGEGKYTFFVSDKTLEVIDHAWLALARIRHDAEEYQRAVDAYRQIDEASLVAPVARYESAWSLFRLGRFARSRQLLEDLLAHDPSMREWPAARLLLGYSMLSDCLFEKALSVFEGLEKTLGSTPRAPPAAGLDRQAGAYVAVPLPARVRAAVRTKRAERRAFDQARGVTNAVDRGLWMREMLRRLASGMPQKPTVQPGAGLLTDLHADLSRVRYLTRNLAELDARLRAQGGQASRRKEVAILEAQVSQAAVRIRGAVERLQSGLLGGPPHDTSLVRDQDLPAAYLTAEEKHMAGLGGRMMALGKTAIRAAGLSRQAWTARAQSRVAGWARAANIGQIDTALGKKQALEIEVQNLAQGRYPLSLFRELAEAGQVDESVEYWPYDGEDWPDEVH